MSLKFSCPNCGAEITARYLKVGDNFICKNCNSEANVPDEATESKEDSTILKKIETEAEAKRKLYLDSIAEGEKANEPSPWGISSIIKFIIATLILIVVFIVITGILNTSLNMYFDIYILLTQEYYKIEMGELGINIIFFAVYIIATGLIYYSVVKRHGHNFFQGLNICKVSLGQFLKYAKLAIYVAVPIAIIDTIMILLTKEPLYLENIQVEHLMWLSTFSFFAIVAAIPEEIIFRGYIYKGLENRLGSIWSGIIVTVLFIFAHAHQFSSNLHKLGTILIFSLVLIYIRIKTDNLTNCIIVHQVYNLIMVTLMWFIFLSGIFRIDI